MSHINRPHPEAQPVLSSGPGPSGLRRWALGLRRAALVLLAALALPAAAAVEVNQASQADLESIKGIGPATSARLLEERKRSPFKDWDDLIQRIKGVGTGNAAQLSASGLTVNGAPYGRATPAAGAQPAKAAKAPQGGAKASQ
jgi:competence protein ComEA